MKKKKKNNPFVILTNTLNTHPILSTTTKYQESKSAEA